VSAPAVGSGDRFGVTLLFSLIAHGVLALGLTFEYEKPAQSLPALDVILVQSATGHEAGQGRLPRPGAQFRRRRQRQATASRVSRCPSPIHKPDPGIAPRPLLAGAPKPQPETPHELLTQQKSSFAVHTEKESPERQEVPAADCARIDGAEVEMARLAEEVQRDSVAYAKRPKKKFISANTKEYEYAAYMSAWVARIERIGNLNYPDEARRQQLHGQLVLTVSVNRDGSVRSADTSSPSATSCSTTPRAAHRQARRAIPAIPPGEKVDEST
jgi:protein TonB